MKLSELIHKVAGRRGGVGAEALADICEGIHPGWDGHVSSLSKDEQNRVMDRLDGRPEGANAMRKRRWKLDQLARMVRRWLFTHNGIPIADRAALLFARLMADPYARDRVRLCETAVCTFGELKPGIVGLLVERERSLFPHAMEPVAAPPWAFRPPMPPNITEIEAIIVLLEKWLRESGVNVRQELATSQKRQG